MKGISHITGGGFYENIPRSLKKGCCARIKKEDVRTPALFHLMQKVGGISEHDMFNTFNMGVGMVLTVPAAQADKALEILHANGEPEAYKLGVIAEGDVYKRQGHNGLEGDVYLCLLHQVEQGVHILILEVGQHQRRGISTWLQHQGAGGLDLHLAQQLGHGPACIGRGDQQQLHPESGGHPLQNAPVGGRKVPAQCQREDVYKRQTLI